MDAISFVLGVNSAQLRSSQFKDLVYCRRRLAKNGIENGSEHGGGGDGHDEAEEGKGKGEGEGEGEGRRPGFLQCTKKTLNFQ